VRPHDISLLAQPDGDAREAQVTRVSHLGFEVRVELQLTEGKPVFAQLTRTEAAQLELAAGDIVWLALTGDRDARLVGEDDRLDAVA